MLLQKAVEITGKEKKKKQNTTQNPETSLMFSMSWCSLTVISTVSPAYPRHEFGQLISVLPHCLGPAPVLKCKAEQRIPICSTQRNTDSVNKIVTAWALPLGIYFIFLHLRHEYDVLIQPITSCTGLEDAHSSWCAIFHPGEKLYTGSYHPFVSEQSICTQKSISPLKLP